MTSKNTRIVAERTVSKAGTRPAKGVAANTRAKRNPPSSHTVSAKSGKVISRTITTHRDALKRLADR